MERRPDEDGADTGELRKAREALELERENVRRERHQIDLQRQLIQGERDLRDLRQTLDAPAGSEEDTVTQEDLVFVRPDRPFGAEVTSHDNEGAAAAPCAQGSEAVSRARQYRVRWALSIFFFLVVVLIGAVRWGPTVRFGLVELPRIRLDPLASATVQPGVLPLRVPPEAGHLWLPLGPVKFRLPSAGPRKLVHSAGQFRLVFADWELRYEKFGPRHLLGRASQSLAKDAPYDDDVQLLHRCFQLQPADFSFFWTAERLARYREELNFKLSGFPQMRGGVRSVHVGRLAGYFFGKPLEGEQRLELFGRDRSRHSYVLLPQQGSPGEVLFCYVRAAEATGAQERARVLARWARGAERAARQLLEPGPSGERSTAKQDPAGQNPAEQDPTGQNPAEQDLARKRQAEIERARQSATRSRSQEALYHRLKESQPKRAREALSQAISAAVDARRKIGLEAEQRRFVKELLRRRLAAEAPPGFALVGVEPILYLSRRLVTKLEYLVHARASGVSLPGSWPSWGLLARQAEEAVDGVTLESAAKFARWRGGRLATRDELLAARRQSPELDISKDEWAADDSSSSRLGRVFRLALSHGWKLREVENPRVAHRLEIVTKPVGAAVLLGEQTVGRTPLTLEFYGAASPHLTIRREGHLSVYRKLTLRKPAERLQVFLYSRSVVPAALRDYATNRDRALALLTRADAHIQQKRATLGRVLYDLVRKAWPGDWVVLKRAERHLARGSDAGQLTEVRRRLVLLDQGVDRIRTQHYRSRLSDMNPSLARLGYDVHFDMVLVPAGRFKFGAEKPGPGERRYATRKTAAFWIDRYEVTNRQYLRFVRATKRRPPDYLTRNLPDERLDHPVSRVSLADAQSYSRWVGKRLPTELEWEKAARGSLYRRYPYGKHFWGKAANTAEARKGGPVSVGSYPLGRSPYGLFDMCGNVCEWTTTLFNPQAPVPNRVAKGGSYLSDRNQCRVATRKRVNPTDGAVDVGFRCCTDR